MAEFDGGALTSDAGGLLLGAADQRLGLGACLDNSGLWWRRLLKSDSVCL